MSNSTYRHLYTDTVDGISAQSNRVKNAYARENTSGWATYLNTAQSTPVNGTGGSPTITLTRNTSSPLRYEADFLITKGVSNTQGQGVSYAFSIDPSDQNKSLAISFDYKASASFVSGTTSDIQVFVYDVTNSTLFTLNSGNLSTSTGSFTSSFTSSSSSSYRLIFHIATTNASAYTFEYTNVMVGSTAATTYNINSQSLFTSSAVTTSSTSVTATTYTTLSNSPAFTFTPTTTGTYKVYATLPCQNQNTTDFSSVRIFNTSGGATLLSENPASLDAQGGFIITSLTPLSVYTLTAGTSYVFDVQAKANSAGASFVSQNLNTWYMFAESLGLTIAANVTPQSLYASSLVNTNSTTITSTSFATFSNSPAFTFTPIISGTYKVYSSVPLRTNANVPTIRIFNTSGGATLLYESQATGNALGASADDASSYIQSVYTLTAGVSYVFDIQAKVLAGGQVTIEGTEAQFYMFAESLGVTISFPQKPSWSGYHIGTSGSTSFTIAGTTYADLVNADSGISLNQITNSNFGTVSGYGANSGASAKAGIVFTPTTTGSYFVKASFTSNIAVSTTYRLWDGTTGIDSADVTNTGAGGSFPTCLSGILNVTSLSSVTVSIQGAQVSSSGGMQQSTVSGSHLIEWSIFRL